MEAMELSVMSGNSKATLGPSHIDAEELGFEGCKMVRKRWDNRAGKDGDRALWALDAVERGNGG